MKMWIEDSGGFKFCSFTRNQIEKCKTSKRSGTPSATDFACKTLYYYVKKIARRKLSGTPYAYVKLRTLWLGYYIDKNGTRPLCKVSITRLKHNFGTKKRC